MSFLQLGERRVEYAWHGPRPEQAPTLVFLHEGLGCVAMWRDFPQQVAEASGCGALVYSRFGYGASSPCALPRPLGYMHDEALQVLPEVLAAAGVQRHVLIGHSDGASIALINAGALPRPELLGVIAEAPHVFCEDVSVASIAKAQAAWRETDLKQKLARYHGENVECAFRGWNEAWLDPAFRDWNIEEYLPRIRVPMQVIQGVDDEYGTVAQVRAIERQVGKGTGAETVLLPQCGHSPHKDQPDATLAAMRRFIARLV